MEKISIKKIINQNTISSYSDELIQKVFETISEGIMITDPKKKIINVNPAFEFVTGYKKEEVVGHSPAILQSGIHDSDFYKSMWNELYSKGEWQGEICNRRKTGDVYPEWLSIMEVRNEQGEVTNYCGVFSDLTEQKDVEDELEKRAMTDSLTGVSNRFAYTERMKVLLESSSTRLYQHAVLFLDLDRFKQINDTLGHAVGDNLLVEVVQRIQSLLKNKDILARYGGDEFVITLTNIHHPREAVHLAEMIIQLLEQPFKVEDQNLYVSTSIGISIYPHDGDDTEVLLTKADKAMYFAKQNGRGQFSFYFDELQTDSKRVLLLDNELRKAIENDSFELHYQPKVSVTTGAIVGVEALVRWQNEKLGFVSPGEFIPYAEETGLIIPISECIINRACQDYLKLKSKNIKNMPIALNISSIHFHQSNFIESIMQILERNNCPAHYFEIELTERTVMNSEKETIRKLVLLKQLGFKLSIDDFGTGYSSLSYLVQFPLNYLKIDRSFIQHICSLDDKQAVVDAIIQMAHRLHMKVIAEGVEQREQVQLLRKMGCDMIQGYYYSKPLPLDEFIEFLEFWELEQLEGK
ncbi:EAL domain-containing protein [Viridibacillus sp. FSL R5-0477]|nr:MULTISPECIES: EAL domain-containing protein [Viridibacillus]OMC84213.1 GGDEF domain-containing protein [Viridibacillus sp. FSL H8-0123]OMC89245.1 GGDEF domain-containing protein [Viridibacillus sp. FSL H7-0596]OMC93684.1 GGDEF domain-containing protein [Viridibacillus arenosi]